MSIAAINRMREKHGLPPIPVAEKASRKKFGNIITDYESPLIGWFRYPSQKQARHARQLDLLWRSGEVRWWLPEIPIALKGQYETKRAVMRIDFLVCWPDGQITWQDAKGAKPTEAWKLKQALVREQYGIEIEIV